METFEKEVETKVQETLGKDVVFLFRPILMMRHKGNKSDQRYRLEFTWEKKGVSYSYARRLKKEEVMSNIPEIVVEVNKLSGKTL